jgi:hypothetical protein
MHGKLFLYSQLFGTMSSKEQKRKANGLRRLNWFSCCPFAFKHLARVHDEATTSDYGSDIGDQFNIVAGADDHDKKAGSQEARYEESACGEPGGARNPRTP